MIVDLDTNTKSFLGDNSDFYLTGSYGKKSSWNMLKHTNKKKSCYFNVQYTRNTGIFLLICPTWIYQGLKNMLRKTHTKYKLYFENSFSFSHSRLVIV